MTKPSLLVVLSLLSAQSALAVVCEGNASNSCNGLQNTCTSEGLCTVDSTTGSCCSLPATSLIALRSAATCNSNADASICSGEVGITSLTTSTVGATLAPEELTYAPTPSPSITSKPTETCYNIEIGIILDTYPEETSWEITEGRKSTLQDPSATVVSASPFYDPNRYREASDAHIVCLPAGKYTFTIFDSDKEDGMCCGYGEGKYVVTYQSTGEMITQGAEFGSSETTKFAIPFEAPTLRDANGDGVEDRTKNIIPTIPLTSDGMPSCSNEFGLHLQTDDYGVETTWELRERDEMSTNYTDGKVIASGGPYTSEFEYDISYCLNPGKYYFIFYDWQCDGLVGIKSNGYYTVKVNGMDVWTGGTDMNGYEEVVDVEFLNPLVGAESEESSKAYVASYSAGERLVGNERWIQVLVATAAAVMAWN
ncbi:predicted protein [Thalassiosira pseudonana CCMP1335]|uniref:PA14 domain-containing protein n=1 Tax=Thalassiosira pseudonana TaxID=35128 RepID=B8LDW4_THAPS|nr:predicted protein [Thalassiosira pseudonana CCMP1335]EED86553.1 predicted protein [Thalassiosira pseudonana CCMP1335]